MRKKSRSVSKVLKRKFIKSIEEGNFEEFSVLCGEDKRVFRCLKNGLPLWLFILSKGSSEMVKLTVEFLLSKFPPFKFRGMWIEVVIALKSSQALRFMCKDFREFLLKEREFLRVKVKN